MNSNENNVGFFSKIRWGVGSISIIILLIILSILFAVVYKYNHNGFYLFLSILFAVVAIIIIIVKSSEIIMPINPTVTTLIGKTGVVIKRILPNNPGVIKISDQLWSAKSDEEIDENSEVEVISVEGIYLKVKRKP
ncbi:membrane protein implicated in regulation of membrane protease activity [Caldisphaera lagunensis DSM 15908]|uniref:Membrane protein implicated in regulation of membrane protease activity n=1 Tax=Caldisphaera lagunensis (strain DSM 15908 / JCM 11604 / ANMR 0165 / IC-154) TaxID=1056495 RepID=L0ABT1_CALLD|nr:NfeD family protein [Caldisphaera lagunensis]AFZ70505.1 membrane protein implicated in regulation of membrane protease activity [Caldisphaera lagunensis DSM 15908]